MVMYMSELHVVIFLPVIVGIVLFIVPYRYFFIKGILACLTALVSLVFSYFLYRGSAEMVSLCAARELLAGSPLVYAVMSQAEGFMQMNPDGLGRLIVLFAGLLTFVISLFSLGYLYPRTRPRHYFSWLLITAGCSNGAVLADHMLLFIFFWGILGLTLFKLIRGHNNISASAAKKTFVLIGASDGIMILGLALIWHLGYPLSISAMQIPANSTLPVLAFVFLLIGAFTKAGAFPFHSWVPDYSSFAPASSSAFLPASLDKLLGIYFIARLFNQMFILNEWITLVVMVFGVATIIIGVMMALVQHNYKRLLGYHAVSQVGYMITGFAMGTPLGIAGGLFHMLNNAIYKSGLFLAAGRVERHTGRHFIEDLGGLSKVMPVTFFSVVIFSLSIAGIPPLNGFASKWLIYQGLIEFGQGEGVASRLWIVWLVLAMFGSALTLASFVKFLSGIFLGHLKDVYKTIRDNKLLLCIPQVVLALICIVFGVFAADWVIPKIIMNVSGAFTYTGVWESSVVSLMVLISLILGMLIYVLFYGKKLRVERPYIMGEDYHHAEGFPVAEFYKTISHNSFFRAIYRAAEKKYFDIYDIGRGVVLGFSKGLSWLHQGILPVYLIWVLAGMLIMFIIFM